MKPAYETYESENYRIVPDNEAGCFDIYNKQGERIGAFDYSDIKVRQDSQTGKQFLISEHGTMSYDAMVLDGELKDALQDVMGVETNWQWSSSQPETELAGKNANIAVYMLISRNHHLMSR